MDEDEDPATTMTRVRGPQPNLSYFAFTATPKSRTLELFGTWDPEAVNPRSPGERGMYVPFHVYSMRQAIEEGFILDVLANYLTYETKWRLRDAATEQAESARLERNPEVDERKAKAKLVRFAELDPTSLRQKAKVIVEDFRDEHRRAARRAGKGHGRVHRAAARLGDVPGSQEMGPDAAGLRVRGAGRVLRVFEGRTGLEFTESQVNGFPESQLPDRFGYVKAR